LIKKGLVVEPLVDFYKDEVRAIGKLLKLPEDLINRHPFPGPGLAIRCLCRDAKNLKDDLSEIREAVSKLVVGRFGEIQSEILPIRSVGVQGDNRTYAHPMALWGTRDWKRLSEMSVTTTNSIRAVNRAMLLLNPGADKPSFGLTENSQCLTRERVDKLRRIDEIVNNKIKTVGIYDTIWQLPVVLIPVTDEQGRESIVLRPINSRDAMTLDFYEMDPKVLDEIVREIIATGEISYVFYDITNKPPGTVEWE
jgi:GMP synthase (glutamine-hydrolysing)